MIVTRVDPDDTWSCLVRRGMLHSETESVEHHRLGAGERLSFDAPHGVDELVVVLSGEVDVDGGTAGPGSVVLVPEGAGGELTARVPTAVLSVRGLAARVTAALPPRVPELPVAERAV